jgi:hypothetical protein
VGNARPAVITAKFWIDKPGIADAIVEANSSDVASLVNGYKYVLILGNSKLSTPGEELVSGDGFRLLRLLD